jgi:transposase
MHPKECRYRAVVHYLHFLKSLRKVSKLYNISKSSLQRWVVQRDHPIRIRKKSQIASSIRKCIMDLLASNPCRSLNEIACEISGQCGLRRSKSTTGRYMSSMHQTWKKAFRRVDHTHSPTEMMAFAAQYTACQENVVCIDEAAFYVGDTRRRGWSQRGKRLCVSTSKTLRRKKYTLIMAISPTGVKHYEILDHNCKKNDFIGFIQRLPVEPSRYLLMDNIAFHHSKETIAAIQLKGCHALFIPPYSPKFNAIENVFSTLKQRYRAKCPITHQITHDYKDTFEQVIRDVGVLDGYFTRVNSQVLRIIASNGIGVSGYD